MMWHIIYVLDYKLVNKLIEKTKIFGFFIW